MKIGDLVLNLDARVIQRNGNTVKISSRAFDLFLLLIEANGAVVPTDKIMARVWPSTIVEENNIQVHISAIRQLLGEHRKLLRTVTGKGYQLFRLSGVIDDGRAAAQKSTGVSSEQSSSLAPDVYGATFGLAPYLSVIENALHDGASIVTICGPAGVGKSRIVAEFCKFLCASSSTSVSYLSLDLIADQTKVIEAINDQLQALFVDGSTGEPTEETPALALLVIDNCDGSHTSVIEALSLSAHPRSKSKIATLLTSRMPLRLSKEQIVTVSPLDLSMSQDGSSAALNLFTDLVREANPEILLADAALDQARNLVQQMDGIPLALEFAAFQTSLLGIETVHKLMQDDAYLPQALRRMVGKRHSSLGAAYKWTWLALGAIPQSILIALMDERHEIDPLMLQRLAHSSGCPHEDIFDAISELVESWFLFREYRGASIVYRLPNTVRRFLRQQTAFEMSSSTSVDLPCQMSPHTHGPDTHNFATLCQRTTSLAT